MYRGAHKEMQQPGQLHTESYIFESLRQIYLDYSGDQFEQNFTEFPMNLQNSRAPDNHNQFQCQHIYLHNGRHDCLCRGSQH